MKRVEEYGRDYDFCRYTEHEKICQKKTGGVSRELLSKEEIKCKLALWRQRMESVGIFNIITSSRDAHGRY